VPADEIELMPPEARLHEPAHALDGGGADGLDVLRRVVAEAPDWLAPRGSMLVEASRRQARVVVGALERAGLVARVIRSDELQATVVAGTAPR
jgi:release factor glutamine methyltransferase